MGHFTNSPPAPLKTYIHSKIELELFDTCFEELESIELEGLSHHVYCEFPQESSSKISVKI